jgi:hypothetical protein
MSLSQNFFGTTFQVAQISWQRLASLIGTVVDQIRHNPSQACESFTKIGVLASLLSAEIVQDLLAARQAPFLPALAGSAFFLSIIATRRWGDRVVSGILVLLYLHRGLSLILLQHVSFLHFIPLSSCLLGLLCARPTQSSLRVWHLPQAWKFPLILWAVLIACSWPIIFMRELDFVARPRDLLELFDVSLPIRPLVNNATGLASSTAAAWAVQTSLVQGLGLLWVDWLFATFPPHQASQLERFRRIVLFPLGLSFCLTSLVAFYQAFIDIQFLSLPHWISARRASGAMLDGNPLGVLAALWVPSCVALALSSPSSRWRRLGPLALLFAWGTMSVSGSMSAMLIVTPTGLYVLWLGWLRLKHTSWTDRRVLGRWLSWGAGGVCVAAGLVWGISQADNLTPWERLAAQMPPPAQRSFSTIAAIVLRDRPFFAELSLGMAAEAPLGGIGLGSFNVVATDFMRKYGMQYYGSDTLPFENALNWYVHQFVELGLLGCIAWGLWIGVFIRTLLLPSVKKRRERNAPNDANNTTNAHSAVTPFLKLALIGLGIGSLSGVHAQSPEILLTFWTITFWLALYVMPAQSMRLAATPVSQALPLPRWILLCGIACTYVIAQTYTSTTLLRIPARAAMAHWGYASGFYSWEQTPDFGEYRWTHRQASTLISTTQPGLQLRLKVHHPDVKDNPVKVQIWINDEPAATVWLRDNAPLVQDLSLPQTQDNNQQQAVLTIQTDRSWQPQADGYGDPRILGVAVGKWSLPPASVPD